MVTEDEVLVTKDPASALKGRGRSDSDQIVQVGPLEHLVDERDALLEMQWEHFDVQMLGSTVGAVLDGLDLSKDLPSEAIDEIRLGLDAYKVVFFREQHLSPEQHLSFARRFGTLEIHPFIPSSDERPELVRFKKDANTNGYENIWHHDVTWRECPSRSTILRAVEVPPTGGDTLFADMCAAYDGLPDDLRAEADELSAVHSFERAFGRQVPIDQMEEIRALYPNVVHPVVCTHGRTGRKFLYVNRVFVDRLTDRSRADSLDLLDRLCRQTDYPEYQCRFSWTPGAIAFWDNRAVQHYANSDYWPAVRIMERASIVGDRPTA